MGIVFDQMIFDGRAPELDRITTAITQTCGLAVVVQESSAEIKGTLYDLHAHLAFACAPEEQLEVFSYRPGAVKEFYKVYTEGIELPTERFVTGLHEPVGTQAIYLRSFVGLEPTLFMVTVLALESLGGKPREPIADDTRREFGTPTTEAQFQERRRQWQKQMQRSAFVALLFLPFSIILILFSLLVMFIAMPWTIWRAYRLVDESTSKRDHRELLDTIPNRMEFIPVQPDDFPELDIESLERYTQAIQALGFVGALDYTVETDVPLGSAGFARLLIHPQRQCYAEINQLFPASGVFAGMRCMFGSLLEDGWGLSTTDREFAGLTWAWRHPRILWTSHPRFLPGELFAEHLQRREHMIDTLHVGVAADVSQDAYFAHSRKCMADRKAVLAAKTIETIRAEIEQFEKTPRHEWLADLPPPITPLA